MRESRRFLRRRLHTDHEPCDRARSFGASAMLVNAAGGARGGRRRGFAKHSEAKPEPARLARRAVPQTLEADPPAFRSRSCRTVQETMSFEAEVHAKMRAMGEALRLVLAARCD